MAELVDALDSGSSRDFPVDVRVILAAMATFAVVTGGEINDYLFLSNRLKHFEKIIAVDSGIRHLLKIGVIPDYLVGDMDSALAADIAQVQGIPTDVYSQDKNESDTELGLKKAFDMGAEEVALFGALGGRTDHLLGNLFLLTRYPLKLRIETEKETLYAISNYKKESVFPGQCISLFPIGEEVKNVTTKGLKWELSQADLGKNFISLSNQALGHTFDVSVGQGSLVCILHYESKN